MPIQWTSNPQLAWPAGADGISVAPSGTAWVFGSYTTIEPAAVSAVLTAVILRTTTNVDNCQLEVQIAVGLPAAEVPIATIKGVQMGHGFDSNFVNVRWVFPIPVDAIPAGSRVSARMRVSNTNTAPYVVSVQYYAKPIIGNLQVSVKPVQVLPFGAVAAVVSSGGSAWTYGTPVQLTASTTAAWIIDGGTMHIASNDEGEIEVLTGTSGSEVVVARFRGDGGHVGGGWGAFALYTPVDVIPAGVRVSARMRGKNAGGACDFAISYREKPI